MYGRILRALRKFPNGLTIHELCMVLNLGRIDYDFCKGCIWLYRRRDFRSKDTQRRWLSKLEDKGCRYNYLHVLRTVKKLEKRGVLRTKKKKLQDPKSTYGFDYFRIVYLDKEARRSILDYEPKVTLLELKVIE